jgi:hypothetical protein
MQMYLLLKGGKRPPIVANLLDVLISKQTKHGIVNKIGSSFTVEISWGRLCEDVPTLWPPRNILSDGNPLMLYFLHSSLFSSCSQLTATTLAIPINFFAASVNSGVSFLD